FATESIAVALYLMGAFTAIGAYQEFTRNLNPVVLSFLFVFLSVIPALLTVWCIFRYRSSQEKVTVGRLKEIIPIVSGMLFLLVSLAFLLAPTYFEAFNRAALLGEIYVEEHKTIIEADGAAMASDVNRELGSYDMAGVAKFMDVQTGLRALSFGLIARDDGSVVAYRPEWLTIPKYTVKQYIAKAKRARGSAAFVNSDDDAVVCAVQLDMGDYLIIGRIINTVAVTDWRRVQNYIGGPNQGLGFWTASVASGLLVVTIVGIWWVATRLSRGDRAQDGLGREGDQQ
ncbi:MAG TPA: hypothetical protein VFO09_07095, partial [Methyloceanibacter sp.]|nr:hypothetical protein [Methyloceanibacter sp.]